LGAKRCLAQIAELLGPYARRADLERLLQAVTLHVVVGNADAHAKNYSLLHTSGGGMALSPLYDVLSTVAYPAVSRAAGMAVAGEQDIDRTSADAIVTEATRWGLAASGQRRGLELRL
jgi:serine/threonine-protein kinase HipA